MITYPNLLHGSDFLSVLFMNYSGNDLGNCKLCRTKADLISFSLSSEKIGYRAKSNLCNNFSTVAILR